MSVLLFGFMKLPFIKWFEHRLHRHIDIIIKVKWVKILKRIQNKNTHTHTHAMKWSVHWFQYKKKFHLLVSVVWCLCEASSFERRWFYILNFINCDKTNNDAKTSLVGKFCTILFAIFDTVFSHERVSCHLRLFVGLQRILKFSVNLNHFQTNAPMSSSLIDQKHSHT